MKEKLIGEITHYYNKLNVATIKLSEKVSTGDTVHFIGSTTDFSQKIESMQYDHKDISSGKRGQEVGIKVNERVREGDKVFTTA